MWEEMDRAKKFNSWCSSFLQSRCSVSLCLLLSIGLLSIAVEIQPQVSEAGELIRRARVLKWALPGDHYGTIWELPSCLATRDVKAIQQ